MRAAPEHFVAAGVKAAGVAVLALVLQPPRRCLKAQPLGTHMCYCQTLSYIMLSTDSLHSGGSAVTSMRNEGVCQRSDKFTPWGARSAR